MLLGATGRSTVEPREDTPLTGTTVTRLNLVEAVHQEVGLSWTESARLVRAITLSEVERDYVAAARAAGARHYRIMTRHLLPRVLGPLTILATLSIGTAIVAESGLSFLGFGIQPPAPTWGWTLAYGVRYLRTDMWLATVPGLAILWTVLGFNLLGDGLRDRLDPKGLSR